MDELPTTRDFRIGSARPAGDTNVKSDEAVPDWPLYIQEFIHFLESDECGEEREEEALLTNDSQELPDNLSSARHPRHLSRAEIAAQSEMLTEFGPSCLPSSTYEKYALEGMVPLAEVLCHGVEKEETPVNFFNERQKTHFEARMIGRRQACSERCRH
jgi:hypothetical protein